MRGVLLVCSWLLISTGSIAQQKCGTELLAKRLAEKHPEVLQQVEKIREGNTPQTAAQQKTNAQNPIPVVFHIVLNEQQQKQIGGLAGIQQRIDSQLAVLNRDFNARNADTSLIPNAFKPFADNPNISFALARTAPDGSATNGYTINTTSQLGFLPEGGIGSGFGFSDAKYTTTGGKDVWDPSSYLNIWVINPINEAGSNTLLLGLAIPYYYVVGNYGVSMNEMGVILHYRAFGRRVSPLDNYIASADLGRTLTHEVGHMFYLFHIWGDDEGKCPFNGGKDDGIYDTPMQAYSSNRCPSFPFTDGCTQSSPGIMYMNFMDYTDDVCVNMFTKGQVERMRNTIRQGEGMYPLTQHPELLVPPIGNTTTDNNFTIYPNPSDDHINILFAKQTTNLKSLHVVSLLGQVVATHKVEVQSSYYHFNLRSLQTGFYILVMDFGNEKKVTKIMVQ
ncbi:MAG: zinc-dependent metalloprotease [Flavipsychrobacter sp.]